MVVKPGRPVCRAADIEAVGLASLGCQVSRQARARKASVSPPRQTRAEVRLALCPLNLDDRLERLALGQPHELGDGCNRP